MPDLLSKRIRILRDSQPTKYGLLSTYYQEVHQVLEACQRNYPCVSQLYYLAHAPSRTRVVDLGYLVRFNEYLYIL